MRTFTCTDFAGHYPVGAAAVMLADTEDEARLWLKGELAKEGLVLEDDAKLEELTQPGARILCNGDY
ncbi:MAG: hypothetical protein RL033_3514 [Pseudomonadota bacterium]|jgi:hypothetical protein